MLAVRRQSAARGGHKEPTPMRRAACIAALPIVLFSAAGAAAQTTMKLGQVLVVHLPDVREGADIKAFESHLTGHVLPAWNQAAPGMTAHLVKKDRGNKQGQYMIVWTTDTIARHKQYASASGEFPFSPAVVAKAGDFRPMMAPYVNGPGRYVEYHLVAPAAVKQPFPEVDVLGLHYARVRPDRREAFDTFVGNKLHPAVGNLRPDLRLLYYRPVRGEDPGAYLTVFALTMASRDKYWPKGADSDVLKATFTPEIKALAEELRTYLVEGAYATGNLAAAIYESKEWADWGIVR
jgi:hypothetical protein